MSRLCLLGADNTADQLGVDWRIGAVFHLFFQAQQIHSATCGQQYQQAHAAVKQGELAVGAGGGTVYTFVFDLSKFDVVVLQNRYKFGVGDGNNGVDLLLVRTFVGADHLAAAVYQRAAAVAAADRGVVFPVAAVVVVFEFAFECAFGNYRLDVGIGITETEAGSNIVGSARKPDRKHRQGGLEEFFGSQRQRLAGKAMYLQQAEVFGAVAENRLGGNQL